MSRKATTTTTCRAITTVGSALGRWLVRRLRGRASRQGTELRSAVTRTYGDLPSSCPTRSPIAGRPAP